MRWNWLKVAPFFCAGEDDLRVAELNAKGRKGKMGGREWKRGRWVGSGGGRWEGRGGGRKGERVGRTSPLLPESFRQPPKMSSIEKAPVCLSPSNSFFVAGFPSPALIPTYLIFVLPLTYFEIRKLSTKNCVEFENKFVFKNTLCVNKFCSQQLLLRLWYKIPLTWKTFQSLTNISCDCQGAPWEEEPNPMPASAPVS